MNQEGITFANPIDDWQIVEFCREMSWPIIDQLPATEDQPAEVVWTADRDTEVHFLQDMVIHRSRLVLFGCDTAPVREVFTSRFDCLLSRDALRMYTSAKDWQERIFALSAISATAPQKFEKETFAMISDALEDESDDVRNMAVTAVFYAPWVQFRDAVARIAASDSNAEVRRRAQYAWQAATRS